MIKSVSFFVVSILIATLVLNGGHLIDAKSKEKKIGDSILKSLGKSLEGKFSAAEIIQYKKFGDNNTVVFWNKTKGPVVPPPPPPVKCKDGEHLENGVCVPDVKPSTGNTTDVCMTGDFGGTAAVADAMTKKGCDIKIGLGDLTYQDTIASFKKLGFERCLVGNHDADEESKGKPIVKEAISYCGNFWDFKVGNHAYFGLNTNDDMTSQANAVIGELHNAAFMKNVTAVHFMSHKPICSTPPNSHHPLESKPKTLCDPIFMNIPANVTAYFENGHNHVLAITLPIGDLNDGYYATVGGGGRSHYSCGVDDIWTWCNNNSYGFLMESIDNKNGHMTPTFYDTKGVKLH